jgi:hypothetical protein
MATQVPKLLAHLVYLNSEFNILVYLGLGCNKAVSIQGFEFHIRKYHNLEPKLRKELIQFTTTLPYSYNSSTIQLPTNGSAPQAILPILDAFECFSCGFLSSSRAKIRQHSNKEHSKKRVVDDKLFRAVRVQSWFRSGKERYWVVNESIASEHAQGARAMPCDSREHSQGEHSQGEHSQAEHRQGAMRATKSRRARATSRDSEAHSSEDSEEHAGEHAREHIGEHAREHAREHAPGLG